MPGKYIYKGQFFKGKKSGNGIMQNLSDEEKPSSIYSGQWSEGYKHGIGKYYDFRSMSFYDGEWQKNKRQGFGFVRTSPT